MEDDRAETADHEVFGRRVGERVPVVAGVAFHSLVEFGVGGTVHGEACLYAGDEERGVVEGVLTGDDELVFCAHGWKLHVGGDGAEVWHYAEDALGLLGAVGADGVGVGCLLEWGGGRCLTGLRLEHSAGSVREGGAEDGSCRGAEGNELLRWKGSNEEGGQRCGSDTRQGGSQMVSEIKGHSCIRRDSGLIDSRGWFYCGISLIRWKVMRLVQFGSGVEDVHLLCDCGEDFEGLVDLVAGVFAGHDGADAGFAFGDGGEGDAGGHEAGVEEGAAEVHGLAAVADEDGGDGGLAGGGGAAAYVEAGVGELLLEVVGVRPEAFDAFGLGLEEIERRNARCRDRGWVRGGEEEGAGAVVEVVDEVAAAADVAAECSDGLGEGAYLHIDARRTVEVIDRAAAVAAEDS